MKPVVAMLFLTLSAFSQQQPSAKGINFYSLETDMEIGREEAAGLESTLLVVHIPKIDAYCSNLLGELARHADSRFAYSFVVYEDRRPTAPVWVTMQMPLNAFRGRPSEPVALPGGPLFIPLSLIAGAPDEAALAFQLAHAMAHVSLRHATRLATREQLVNLASIPLIQIQNTSTVGGAAVQVTAQIAQQAAVLTLARQMERAADAQAAATVRAQQESLLPAAADPGAFDEVKALAAAVR